MTDALVSNRLVEEAEQLVGDWKELVPPNTVIYSTLIHGWAKQNDANRARSIFALMRDENVLCNAVTFNCLIHACVRVGDMQGALELLDAMKLQAAANADVVGSQDSDHAGGLLVPLPDKFTYSTIIKGYCARGEMEQSLQMFDTMLGDGLQPDLVIYNTLLDGCVKRRYHGTCERLLDDMTNYWKIQPNSYTLSILIKHYGRQGDLERAFNLVEELPAKHGFEANAHVWTCLISACITHGEMETAQAIFDVMRKVKPSRRQETNGQQSTTTTGGGSDGVNASLATPAILRMAAKCAPDAKAYETQIHGWIKYNRQDKVKELTEDLERKFGMPTYSRNHHHHRGSSRRR
ncbi:pentatricopeptide repeat-containing protein, putative [Perkinsus marinus ATCC 50983]|uniref:Pentatricopeptide repeat-containing protein, putative n=1 Tax=Perkinsus marinus (strain ATCC 50983 / TXsc) TaxID=423536 RepID=C5KEB3_PERM5|nr:pentatricopeptide repeat-containing protein, putative [Perkinsus marinus ATCC 50983]EER17180.1 pentatricopeptide repeat-containing protein, putative [Perkinsus marinus ATCC 50983]|eukprot:XP_002785384.1 pentatricopeptide repeat-containing protein, putative [Perkinsus marinus ATCC 50983]